MTQHKNSLLRNPKLADTVRKGAIGWMSDREIAESLKCSIGTVRGIRRLHGLASGKQRRGAYLRARIMTLRLQGLPFSKIGTLLNMTRARAHQLSKGDSHGREEAD